MSVADPRQVRGDGGTGAPDAPAYAVVVPTIGRECLADCLAALATADGPPPVEVVVVDDRPEPGDELPLAAAGVLRDRLRVRATHGAGPAAARNAGLREAGAPWVVFLDDDVRVDADWRRRLAADLAAASPATGGVQGRLVVPLPEDRRPTDWERGTAGLADASWATADMAYRADALRAVGGFDERFRRAFREDADLALRVLGAGWELRRGARTTRHPVRPAGPWVSVRAQRGNADDVLMTRLHGRDWWTRARAPKGRFPGHLLVTAAAAAVPLCLLTGHRRPAALAASLWALGTAEFTAARLRGGPWTAREVATMAATSVLIPPLAVGHRLAGTARHHGARPWQGAP
ncbi:glycosyltransferase family 2 protein [Streptomyces sp. BRB081]|uniref:glycosyltransferase family 2 protein n=1 Tax=Streptomyces sp. BRB081 TaxID=2769544 RepID=UPI0018ACAA2F|nr:glycosyltransferase [Streptomyces sp. BRB081]MBL3803339.1 glycosyltransferase [Streptomyces sp. BRB081]